MQTAVRIQAVFRGHRCRKEQDEEAEDDDAPQLVRTVSFSRRRRKAGRGRVTVFKRSETKRGTRCTAPGSSGAQLTNRGAVYRPIVGVTSDAWLLRQHALDL